MKSIIFRYFCSILAAPSLAPVRKAAGVLGSILAEIAGELSNCLLAHQGLNANPVEPVKGLVRGSLARCPGPKGVWTKANDQR